MPGKLATRFRERLVTLVYAVVVPVAFDRLRVAGRPRSGGILHVLRRRVARRCSDAAVLGKPWARGHNSSAARMVALKEMTAVACRMPGAPACEVILRKVNVLSGQHGEKAGDRRRIPTRTRWQADGGRPASWHKYPYPLVSGPD